MQMAEEKSGGQQGEICHRKKPTEETAHGQCSSCPRLRLANVHRVCTLDHRWPLPGQVEGRSRDITKTVGCRIKHEWEIRSLSQRRHHMVCCATPIDNRGAIWGGLFEEWEGYSSRWSSFYPWISSKHISMGQQCVSQQESYVPWMHPEQYALAYRSTRHQWQWLRLVI